jgi:predicted O-methyltransferase YrrM
MQFIDEALDAYVCDHTSPASDLLNKINRDTHIEVLQPRMLSGHFQGRLLSMLSKMIRPERILEIGTYTGYSALCLAEGLTPTGKIVTMDINEELESRVRNYFCSSQFSEQIDYRIGDASTLITGLNEQWDLVFIDADKQNYLVYYKLVFNQVKKGGYLIADNVLWSGKVIEDDKQDKDTILIRQFNEFIKNDERVECIMLPVRDGLTIVRKR